MNKPRLFRRRVAPALKRQSIKISIILIVNNANLFRLEKTIESCLNQNSVTIEVVIATMTGDPCIDFICNNYKNRPRVKFNVIKKIYNNTYMPKLYNRAVSIAQFEWITFITPNFIMTSNKCYEEIHRCLDNDMGICCTYDIKKNNDNIINHITMKTVVLRKYMPFNIRFKNNTFINFWNNIKLKEVDNIIFNDTITLKKVTQSITNNTKRKKASDIIPKTTITKSKAQTRLANNRIIQQRPRNVKSVLKGTPTKQNSSVLQNNTTPISTGFNKPTKSTAMKKYGGKYNITYRHKKPGRKLTSITKATPNSVRNIGITESTQAFQASRASQASIVRRNKPAVATALNKVKNRIIINKKTIKKTVPTQGKVALTKNRKHKPVDNTIRVVMISINDFAGSGYNICECLSENGKHNIRIEHILCNRHEFNYPYRILFQKSVLYYCNKVIRNADIIHFKGDNVLVNYRRFFRIPKDTVIITTIGGSLFRRKKVDHLLPDNKQIMNKIVTFDGHSMTLRDFIRTEMCKQKYKFSDYNEYSSLMTGLTCDLIAPHRDKRGNLNMIFTPHAIDCENIKNEYHYTKGDPIIIGHSPSDKLKKGTDEFLIPAIQLLKNKGYQVELKLLIGDHSEVLKQKKSTTLFFDQCYVGWYGISLVEAIQYGIPSICYINKASEQVYRSKFPDLEFPIIKIKPSINNIVEAIENVINKCDINLLSAKTKEYCDKVHGYSVNAKLWSNLYRKLFKNPRYRKKYKALFFEPTLCIKTYKYAKVFSELGYIVDVMYNRNNFDHNYNVDTKFINTMHHITLFESFVKVHTKYDVIFFKDISKVLCDCLKAKINCIVLLGDIKMMRSDHKQVIQNEKYAFSVLRPEQIIFPTPYMKEFINDMFGNKFITSPVIPNVPLFKNIPKDKFEKLSKKDGKIHIVYIGCLQIGHNHRNYEDIINKIIKHDKLKLHIIPTKHTDGLDSYNCDKNKFILHKTHTNNDLISYLTQFDIGLNFFNVDYDFSNYIDITVSNKFYDYLFAGLPMILNNTKSYKHLNSIYKCGINIDSVDLGRIDEIAHKVKGIKIDFNPYDHTLQNYVIDNWRFFQ
jgi:hypothetical protein